MLTGRHHTDDKGRGTFLLIIFFLMAIHAIPACSPKIVERIVVQRDTLMVHHRDTTYQRDSVYIREWMKGDTVFVDRFRDRYVYRDRWRDSVRIVERHDTTSVEVKVEKNLSWGQKAKIGAFPWLLLTLAGALLWIFRKFIFK